MRVPNWYETGMPGASPARGSNWYQTGMPGSSKKKSTKKKSSGGSANAAEYRAAQKPTGSSANAMEQTLRMLQDKTGPKASGTNRAPSPIDVVSSAIPARQMDYGAEAAAIYKPAMDYLRQQQAQAKSGAAADDRDLANMYSGLVGQIVGQGKGISAEYNDAIGDTNANTKQAVGSIDQTYDSAANEQAAMLKALGIQAAAPDTLAQNTSDEAFMKALAQSSGNATRDELMLGKESSLDFNTEQGNISRQAGVDARADNKLGLQAILGQLQGKQADLSTQINQQAASMQQSAIQSQIDAQKAAAAQANSDRDYQLRQAGLMLNTAKFDASKNATSAAASKTAQPQDPWGKGQQVAMGLYDNNPQAAGNALQAVQDAIAKSPDVNQWSNANDLVRAVLNRNQNATDVSELTALATYLYQQIFGK